MILGHIIQRHQTQDGWHTGIKDLPCILTQEGKKIAWKTPKKRGRRPAKTVPALSVIHLANNTSVLGILRDDGIFHLAVTLAANGYRCAYAIIPEQSNIEMPSPEDNLRIQRFDRLCEEMEALDRAMPWADAPSDPRSGKERFAAMLRGENVNLPYDPTRGQGT